MVKYESNKRISDSAFGIELVKSNGEMLDYYKLDEEIEDLGKKEYVIESTVSDDEITIAYNHPNGYDDSDDSIYIRIVEDDDYTFATISIQSAKDMIIALQEIVDYVEGGK